MALSLAAIGIYGMLAYTVTLRRKEIGVRMAPGSSGGGITGLVLRHASWLISPKRSRNRRPAGYAGTTPLPTKEL